MTISKSKLSNGLSRILDSNILIHIGFWFALTMILTFLDSSMKGFGEKFILVFIHVSFYAIIVYINLLYLFPKYLIDKKLSRHLIWLLLSAALLTPIKTMTLYLVANNIEAKQTYLNNQSFFFLSTFFVAISSSIYYILNDWLKGQRERQELTNKTLQSELNFLKSQINPHFLFNTLNSLYALTLKKSDLAPEIVLKLSEMMRYMLYECNERRVPLQKEINYLVNYLELEKLRHGKKMSINLNINGEPGNKLIAPLMFIPFLENCFKHGLSHQIAEGFVNIDLDINKSHVVMAIENSKAPSVPGDGAKKSGGIGLVNVRRRLELMYPNQYELKVLDGPNTYKIELSINLNHII